MLRKQGTSEVPSLHTMKFIYFFYMCNKYILNSHNYTPESQKNRREPWGESVLSGLLALPQMEKLHSHRVFDGGLKVHRRIEALALSPAPDICRACQLAKWRRPQK